MHQILFSSGAPCPMPADIVEPRSIFREAPPKKSVLSFNQYRLSGAIIFLLLTVSSFAFALSPASDSSSMQMMATAFITNALGFYTFVSQIPKESRSPSLPNRERQRLYNDLIEDNEQMRLNLSDDEIVDLFYDLETIEARMRYRAF